MTNILIIDTVKSAIDTVQIFSETNESMCIWMWIAFAEFIAVIYLLLKGKYNRGASLDRNFKSESAKQEIDFSNIINSSFNSEKLYDELKAKCHPDRFSTDKEKNLIAESIFQQITENKTNVKRLLELREEAIQELNIPKDSKSQP